MTKEWKNRKELNSNKEQILKDAKKYTIKTEWQKIFRKRREVEEKKSQEKFEKLQEEIKEKANNEGVNYIPLKKNITSIKRINLRSSNKNKDKDLDFIKTLKNAIYFPTIPSSRTKIESEINKLRDWDYWAIELDSIKIDSEYLSLWFGQEIPKLQFAKLGSGAFMKSIKKEDLDKIHIFDHSLPQQRKIKENLKTALQLEEKAKKIKYDNIFNPTHISIEDIVNEIPDLELELLLESEESVKHELKSSLRFNTKEKKVTDWLVNECLKTIVAFLNTEGGHLLIGINDKKELLGIEIDNFKSQDEWHRYLKDKIKHKIGLKYLENYIKVEFKNIDEKTIAIIKCAALSPVEHALVDDILYVRKGPATHEIPKKEMIKWGLERAKKV